VNGQQVGERAVRAGYVAIIGRPNAGKSTLLNALLGQKLSIVTAKAQTTRHRILSILSEPDYQLILLDTPGIMTVRACFAVHRSAWTLAAWCGLRSECPCTHCFGGVLQHLCFALPHTRRELHGALQGMPLRGVLVILQSAGAAAAVGVRPALPQAEALFGAWSGARADAAQRSGRAHAALAL